MMTDEKRLEIANEIAERMTNGGARVWTKMNDDGTLKICRVYSNHKGYYQVDADAVNHASAHSIDHQAVYEYLTDAGIEMVRR